MYNTTTDISYHPRDKSLQFLTRIVLCHMALLNNWKFDNRVIKQSRGLVYNVMEVIAAQKASTGRKGKEIICPTEHAAEQNE